MPTSPRLYLDQPLREAISIELAEQASNYLARVLRMRNGEIVRLFNARDGEWASEVVAVGTRRVTVRTSGRLRAPAEAGGPRLTLLFSPVKKDATDLIAEKATELGAKTLIPVITARTQARVLRVDRLKKIALEAAEQTERLDLPDIEDPIPLNSALAGLPLATALVFCDEAGDEAGVPWGGETGRAPPIATVLPALRGLDAAILIGPEGGFTPAERAGLRSRPATYPVSLGPRILRAETAAIAAMTLWQALCGDWTGQPLR